MRLGAIGAGMERTAVHLSALRGGGRGVLGPQWLGPRTAKAFRAAGLLDFDREQEQDRDRSADFSDATTRLRSGSVGGRSVAVAVRAWFGGYRRRR